MIRPPPRSTLFPYPALFRSEAVPGHWTGPSRAERLVFLEVGTDDHAEAEFDARALDVWFPPAPPRRAEWALSAPGLRVGYLARSEEHTSELQSQSKLVCRLL